MKHISVETAIERGKLSSENAFLTCLVVKVVNPATGAIVETLRLVQNTEDIVYNGNTYTAAAFEISTKSESGSIPQVNLTIKDKSRAVQARMQAYNGGVGFKVDLLVVNSGDLDAPPEVVEYFETVGASAKDYNAEFTLGAENVLTAPFPRRRQTKRFCQWRYKGFECGYRDEQYLNLPGTSGNYAKTPDSTAFDWSQNWLPYSEDLAAWSSINSVGVGANAYADPNGDMTMDTLTDDSASLYEGKSYNFGIPNDGAVYQWAVLVRKDLSATHRVGINAYCATGGTLVGINARFALDGTNVSGCTVASYDANNWLVSGTITNNNTGNTTLTFELYPATATTKGGADNAAATGSATFGWCRVQRSSTLLPYKKTTGTAIRGNVDLRIKLALDDWTPATGTYLLTKDDGSNRSFGVYIHSTNILRFETFSPLRQADATAALPFTDGQTGTIKITFNPLTGAVNFYTSINDGESWTPLGSTVTVSTGVIPDTVAPMAIGANGAGSAPADGKVFWAEIRDGIDGTVVSKFDARDLTVGSTSGASLTTGETWTVYQSGSPSASIAYSAGYPKATCDLTLQGANGCAAHNNTLNFGAYQGLNNSGNKYA